MANKRESVEEALPLPQEVAEALDRCGGITGLIGSLPRDEALERESAFYRALADPIRLKILVMLAIQPLCVCVIRVVLGISDSKLSYHLGVLKRAGLIAGEAQGNWIIYSLTEMGRSVLDRRVDLGEG